ncbi:hypothetical protein AB4Y80_16780, partial [Specibacter sp. RAF43]
MKDPQPERAGSEPGRAAAPPPAADPAEPRPAAGDPGYQFPTRKARRIAELTGKVPAAAPEKHVPEKHQHGPALPEDRDPGTTALPVSGPGGVGMRPGVATPPAERVATPPAE